MENLDRPILDVARDDPATLPADLTIGDALHRIRDEGIGERIVYFYAVDAERRLVGVVPVRRLLTAPLDKLISSVMVSSVVSLPRQATHLDAHEAFARHRLLALPLVDDEGRVVGVVDLDRISGHGLVLDQRQQIDEVFEAIGFRLSQLRDASPARAFRVRMPWLISTIVGGTTCALLASVFELTLAKSIVLAFFMTLVLGLAESVSMQSMTVTIQALRSVRPTLRWYIAAARKEAITALFLGMCCGGCVGLIVWIWRGDVMAAITIGTAIGATIWTACIFGITVPAVLHALKLDPKVAAGPITLAMTDICTIILYLGLATFLL
jgi:magnesium transporter